MHRRYVVKLAISGHEGNLGQRIIKYHSGDVEQIGRNDWGHVLSDCDIFIHCAYDLRSKIFENPASILDSNVLTVGKSLELVKRSSIKRYVFISSCSVYGDSSQTAEDKECRPINLNGQFKLLGESIVSSFCEENKIEYLIIRAFNSYGGSDQFSVVSKMIESAKLKREFNLVNDGVAERDFIHIKDLAKVILLLLEKKELRHNVYNVGTGRSTKVKDILDRIEKKFGPIKVRSLKNPKELPFSKSDNSRLSSEIEYDFINILKFYE